MKYLKVILTLTFFTIIFILLNILLKPKYMTDLVEGSMTNAFYKEDMVHDVIFIGDCEVYANFSPLEMYETSGITSYVRGNSQQLIWQSYYLLKETLKYETPEVVVFNVNSMRYSKPVSEAYNRLMIDNMKWSKEKIDLINASKTEEENFLSYVLPIMRYHSRITELTKEDFEYLFRTKKTTYNGFLINKNIKPYTSFPKERRLPTYEFQDIDYEYLDKIRTLLEEKGIRLVLIKAPSLYPYWYDEYETQIKEYASTYNIDYYNLKSIADSIGIDYETDTYDGGLHLNYYGAKKLSKYFGELLKKNYNLTDYRSDAKISEIYNKKLIEYKKALESD